MCLLLFVCCVLFERGVLCVFLLCLIVVPLLQGKNQFAVQLNNNNIRLHGIVVRVPDYQRSGFDSRRCQIFWEVVGLERGPLNLVSTTEELLGRTSSGSGLEIRAYGRRAERAGNIQNNRMPLAVKMDPIRIRHNTDGWAQTVRQRGAAWNPRPHGPRPC
jgi:hypothetical protein